MVQGIPLYDNELVVRKSTGFTHGRTLITVLLMLTLKKIHIESIFTTNHMAKLGQLECSRIIFFQAYYCIINEQRFYQGRIGCWQQNIESNRIIFMYLRNKLPDMESKEPYTWAIRYSIEYYRICLNMVVWFQLPVIVLLHFHLRC